MSVELQKRWIRKGSTKSFILKGINNYNKIQHAGISTYGATSLAWLKDIKYHCRFFMWWTYSHGPTLTFWFQLSVSKTSILIWFSCWLSILSCSGFCFHKTQLSQPVRRLQFCTWRLGCDWAKCQAKTIHGASHNAFRKGQKRLCGLTEIHFGPSHWELYIQAAVL